MLAALLISRRTLLKSAALLALPWKASPLAAASGATPPASSQRFDFAWLKGQALGRAQSPYRSVGNVLPNVLAELDWDRYQSIRFRPERGLWVGSNVGFQVRFFHLGRTFDTPVQMYEVVNAQARPIRYDPAMFDLRKSGINPRSLRRDLGFAGFRVHFHTDWDNDIVAFLGASYFRAVGSEKQYGLSARGLAIDTGLDRPEEFPTFEAFWLERPEGGTSRLTVYALMDSPSIAGAYRFDITPGSTLTMDVDAAIYPRREIERLGIAPLTSMFLCGENDRRMANDWRPEIHDSDGLAIWTGAGERIWRPLLNPARLRVNSYVDQDPRGFGLLQRDRDFDHYQDDGVHYNRRPSAWIEPKASGNRRWGKGAVQLVEIPTADETADNVVAFWSPSDKPQPGQELLVTYRIHWDARAPFGPSLGQVVATRNGVGGTVGQKRKYYSWRFTIDFVGGQLAALGKTAKVEAVVTASRGAIELAVARPQVESQGYRAMVDIRPTDDSVEPIDLRLYLRLGHEALTETWVYQWTPPPAAERSRWLSRAPADRSLWPG
jgi:periplasmic glucans biosynthesis protein